MPLTQFLGLNTGIESEILNFKANQNNSDTSISSLKNYDFKQNKSALYLITEWDLDFVELALGGRAELFDSKGEEAGVGGQRFTQNYFNIYPNAQLSMDIGGDSLQQTLMFSYSKRINRPEYEQLSPSIIYNDPLNISQGNPSLKPEFAHIFELGHEITAEKLSIFTTLFHRITDNVVQSKQQLLANNILLSTYSNQGNRTNTGVELYLKYDLTGWWDLSNDFTIYNKRFTGQTVVATPINGINLSNKIINNFKLRGGFKVQLQAKYVGQRTSLFYSSDPYYTVNIGASKDVIKGKGKITLGVRDVFDTIKLVSTNTQSTFTEKTVTKYTTRMINLGFSLNF
jgi:outer membrane receptor protein involved in Fe transport